MTHKTNALTEDQLEFINLRYMTARAESSSLDKYNKETSEGGHRDTKIGNAYSTAQLFFGSFREGDKEKITITQSSPTAPSQDKLKIFRSSDDTKMIFLIKRQKQLFSTFDLHGSAKIRLLWKY